MLLTFLLSIMVIEGKLTVEKAEHIHKELGDKEMPTTIPEMVGQMAPYFDTSNEYDRSEITLSQQSINPRKTTPDT